jgi:diguanylate cyclase (GGDEF)-like protein/PAS domain S-box-containing protein
MHVLRTVPDSTMPSRLDPRAVFGVLARVPRRASFRALVVVPAVAVIVAMAIVVSNSVADEIRESAKDSAVQNIEAIVRGYVDPDLQESSLDLAAPRDPDVDAQLERLILSGEIRRVNVWSRDGRIVYSSSPELRGQRFSIGPLLASAYAGDGVARYIDAADAVDASGEAPPGPGPLANGRYLELFVPIRGMVDGNPIGVYDVYQDASRIEQRIAATRLGVFIVALIAASLLTALIVLAFGGASRVLTRQNRQLQDQAATERLLLVDLQRSEERFRSLVRNASDGVIVLGADGLIRYESPAVERILGRTDAERVGRPATTDVHVDDRAAVQRRLAEVASTSGSEATFEFRARHADDTWRTLEAIAKNLLDDPAVGGVVVNYRDITERKALEEQLRHQAFHDVLTGLANRSLFRDRLGHALARAARGASPTAVLYLDIDDFKAVNDRLGHAEGDRLLVAVGQRLRLATRAGDTVARLGGDEFAVIVEETDPIEARRAADRILEILAEPFDLGGRQTTVRASVGIASQAIDGADADELLRRADIAMYAAKSRGGDGHATYEASLSEATVARMESKADLQGALERGELDVAYQPIVDIGSGAVTGTEALMRWQHPDRGLIPPSEFIPLAEENGLILELGRWILEMACRQTKAWQDEAGRADLTVSVNLSGRQIADSDLVGDVARVLASSGLDPACLTLEITESVLVRDIEATVAAFRALKRLGIRLAIDDFGTGYSSLSYLRQFPIDILKIDQSFVASLEEGAESSALVRSILNLSATLHLDTVAEGIETAEQRSALESLGANRGQGYLFARPMNATNLGSLLATGGSNVADVGPTGGTTPPTPSTRGRAAGLRASRRSSTPHHEVRP